MRQIAGVKDERRWLGRSFDLGDRRPQCRGDVSVRRLVESNVAVTDLDEAEDAGFVRRCSAAARPAQWRSFENAARQRPDGPRAGPCHAFQKIPSIELLFITCC